MKITAIHYTCTCRKCSVVSNMIADIFTFRDGLDIEVALHVDLESKGWIDQLCPECVEKELQ